MGLKKASLEIDAIILARKNSKRLKNKHHLMISGKKMISYTFDSVLKSKFIKNCYCFTDDKRINKIIKNKKIDFSIKRPEKISGDKTSSEETILYLLKILKKRKKLSKNFILLQPTSPLRTSKLIDLSIKYFFKKKFTSLLSLKRIKKNIFNIKNKKVFLNKNETFISDGAIYICNTKYFLKHKKFISSKIGYVELPEKSTIDVDTIDDLNKVRKVLH